MSSVKRRRCSSVSEHEPLVDVDPMPIRSEGLWFDNGNVVLQAEGIQFRVHQTILSKTLPVFTDMLDVPGQPTLDDYLTIHLSDAGKDVEHFLKVLYNP